MTQYYGDFLEDETVYIPFNTFSSDDPAASVTITNLAAGDIKVHKDGSTTEIVTDGATIAIDFDSVTGNHLITIDTSASADYSTGSDYLVRIEGTTVDGATINAWVGSFSIENRTGSAALRPTTSGRTLDVTATGAAGVDWGNVENASSTVDLSNTSINLCDTTTDVTNQAGLITSGTAQSVTSTTIVLASGETFADDELIGATVHIKTASTGAGQSRVITDYTGSTDTATVDTWITTPTGTITYEIYATAPSSSTSLPAVNVTQVSGVAEDLPTATALATVDANVDAILVDTADMQPKLGTFSDLGAGATLAGNITDLTGATFSTSTDSLEAIRNRGDAAWTTGAGGSPPQLLQSTTIATLASQTSFTLTAGSADDDAYNGAIAVITDSATSTQKAVGTVSDYTGATRTVTLSADPGIFTMAVGDTIEIIAALGSAGSAPTAAQVADAVWDEAQSGHTGAGTFGEIATEIASILVDTAEIGAAGAGLTGVPWNAAWDAEVQSEVTDALNAYDPPTKAELDSGLAALNDPTASAIADAVWDEPTAGHVTAGTTGKAITDALEDTQDIQSRIPAALVGGRIDANVGAISGDSAAADNLEAAMDSAVTGQAQTGTLSTTQMSTNLSEATDDHFIGRLLTFTSGVLLGQQTDITDYDGASKTLTFTALTEAPSNGDAFIIT